MPAPESVKKLIETFGNNLDFYKSGQYNEAQLRQEFLDPFFKELGWDMDNAAGLAPQYRDVIHEASIKIGGSTKAPDYAFSIHGDYKFFLEAKKPAEHHPDIMQQLETQLTATDRQIDRLVYDLYELTEEEIALVEGTS